jgi:hypothetical protein
MGDQKNIAATISTAQYAVLLERATERGVRVRHVVRDAVAAYTGIPTPTRPPRPPKHPKVPPEEAYLHRATNIRRVTARLTPEQRSARSLSSANGMTREARVERARKGGEAAKAAAAKRRSMEQTT